MMRLFVSQEYAAVVAVSVRDVPADFLDADVRYTFELAADRGDPIAELALPFIRVSLNADWRAGTRVYLDN